MKTRRMKSFLAMKRDDDWVYVIMDRPKLCGTACQMATPCHALARSDVPHFANDPYGFLKISQ